jgi:hypothetical protein
MTDSRSHSANGTGAPADPIARVTSGLLSTDDAARLVWLGMLTLAFVALGTKDRWALEHWGGIQTVGAAALALMLFLVAVWYWMRDASVLAQMLVAALVFFGADAAKATVQDGMVTSDIQAAVSDINVETNALRPAVKRKFGSEAVRELDRWRAIAEYVAKPGRGEPNLEWLRNKLEVAADQTRYCAAHLRAPPRIANGRLFCSAR